MSYVPPHMRRSNEHIEPSPFPGSVLMNSSGNRNKQNKEILCADDSFFRWLYVSSDGVEGEIPTSVKLVPVSEWRAAQKPLVLVKNDVGGKDEKLGAAPWLSVAEKVEDYIVTAFEMAKNGKDHGASEELKTRLVARFGKILVHGHPSVSLESLRDGLVAESTLRAAKKSFYTNVPASYMESIMDAAVLKLGVCSQEKDMYYVMLSDETRPGCTITCKCSVREDNRLNLYKVQFRPLKHCVVDFSCLDRNIDLRLTVYSKRLLTDLTETEICNIRKLIGSAVLDPNVKGGLRWPLGEASSGGRNRVCSVWHVRCFIFSSPTLRLTVREADRFNFRDGTGEAAREVSLVLKGVSQKLEEEVVERSSISDMLKDALKLVWDHFLSAHPYLV